MDISFPEPLNSLTGGLENKAVTNIFGAPGTGKTNICIMATLDCVSRGGKVVYIDTEGGFSPERLKQLTSDCDNVYRRLEIIEPKTFEEQGMVIRKLGSMGTNMIIVDSMVALYRLEYSEEKKDISERMGPVRELSKQLSILSNLARERNIPVFLTSHMFRNWDTKLPEVVGGDLMKYWSKTIVYIEKTNRMSERRATIMKHRFAPEGGNVKFNIVSDGIRPSGFRIF